MPILSGKDWVQQHLPLDAVAGTTDLRAVMLRRCHVRLHLMDPRWSTARVAFVDAAGDEVSIHEDRASTSMITMSYRLHDGKSEVLSVSEAAVLLVVRQERGRELARLPIALRPGEINQIVR